MPQRIMVLVDDRRHRSTRRMEEPLQQRQTPYLTRQLDAERVRKTNSNSSRNWLEPGPQNGAAPARSNLTSQADHSEGAGHISWTRSILPNEPTTLNWMASWIA